jgi:peptide/nickel transport system ATP-binding protein
MPMANGNGANGKVGDERKVLLEARGLKKYFPVQQGFLKKVVGQVKAVDDVSFSIYEGETLGLVGESGSGKSTVAKLILRAIEPTDGEVLFKENDDFTNVVELNKADLKRVRKHIQMIFQDPHSSLNPRQRVRDIIGEPLLVNGVARGKELEKRVAELMDAVGLRSEYMIRYPHAFSGGQRQRIGIARALALNPKLIVCDEPVSALDVSIQAQILNLLNDLQEEFGLTYLFIAHDLGVVQHISDRVAVMYAGRLAEVAPARQLFKAPRHPYTEALLATSPRPHPRYRGDMQVLSGEVPDISQEMGGCYFRYRCPHAQELCAEKTPPLKPVKDGEGEHRSACHFADDLSLVGV